MTSTKELKKQKNIIERNIKLDKERIKNPAKGSNTALKNCPNPSHWKEALKYDKKALNKVKNRLATRKVVNNFKKGIIKVTQDISKSIGGVGVANAAKQYKKKINIKDVAKAASTRPLTAKALKEGLTNYIKKKK